MKELFLLCGPPGSGKSTWAKSQIEKSLDKTKCVIISRDEIRFSLISDEDEYFSKEDLVFETFIKEINKALQEKDSVYVDATHLSSINRNKVLDRLELAGTNIIPVNFETSLETCMAQNNLRTGREKVPERVVKNMWYAFAPATYDEKHKYFHILYA